MNMRVTNDVTREAVSSDNQPRSSRKNVAKHLETNLENMVDNCINKLQQENDAMNDVKTNQKKANKKPKVWLKNKEAKRKTYGKKTRNGNLNSESPIYSGEELSGDEDYERRGGLPLVAVDSGDDKVGRWLDGGYQDLSSQPTASQASVSTPHRTLSTPIRSFAGDLSSISPLTSANNKTLPLSPVDVNVVPKKKDMRKDMLKAIHVPSNISIDDTVPLSQAVDVNDTFDKLLMDHKKKPVLTNNQKDAADSNQNKQECEFICSQTSSNNSFNGLGLLGDKLLKNLETSAEWSSDPDLENVKTQDSMPGLVPLVKRIKGGESDQKCTSAKSSQGWNKVETSFNEFSKVVRRKSKLGSLEFEETNKSKPNVKVKLASENKKTKSVVVDMEVEDTDDKAAPNDISVEDCQGFNTQEAKQAVNVIDKYRQIVKDQENFENKHENMLKPSSLDKDMKPATSASKVTFSLFGRIAPAKKPRKEKMVNFLQLGCLASPKTKKFNLPTLKTIINKNQSNRHEVSNYFVKNEDASTNPIDGVKLNYEPCPPIAPVHIDSNKANMRPLSATSSVLQSHIEQVPASKLSSVFEDEKEMNSGSVSRVEGSVPEEDIPWIINDPVKSVDDQEQSFMQDIIGDNKDVYSQDAETKEETNSRVARIEFEEEMMEELDMNRKRQRAENDDVCEDDIEEIESPVKPVKKVARIDSDTYDTPDIGATPERPKSRSKFRSITVTRRSSRMSIDDEKTTQQESALQSRSLLDSPAVAPSVVSRSSNSVTSVSDGDLEKMTTQEMEKEIHAREEKAKKLREEAKLIGEKNLGDGDGNVQEEGGSDVEPMFDEGTSAFLEQQTSQKLAPVFADIVLDTETMDVGAAGALTDTQTRVIPDSDDDLFSQTPERPSVSTGLNHEQILSPVKEMEEEEDDFVDSSEWRFVLSNLSMTAKKTAMEFIGNLGCKGVSSTVDRSVTHLVVKTGDNLEAQRTLKFLQAVSSGIMIVSFGWIEACIKDMKNLGKADKWEVLDEEMGGANGPFRARKSREEGRQPLLKGYEILIQGDLDGLDESNINDLLSRVEAKTVPTVNLFSCTPGITRIVIVNSTTAFGAQKVSNLLKKYRLATVDKDWLLDTVSTHSVRSLLHYTLDTIVSGMDLVRAGYSGPLVDQEE